MNLYLQHFGLREPPFKITPTTDFFYGGGLRSETLHALQYAINIGEGIMMVTGEVGSGKTMLLRTLADKLPEHVELVYIPNPSLSGREILYNICEELGLNIDIERPNVVRRLQEYLVEQHSRGRHVVTFIDEAQAMPDESLEEIRLLSNLETDRHKLMQVVMFGQPELLDKLEQQNMRQLRDRITVALSLNPFSRSDVQEYISTRLNAAGYNGGQLFSPDSCQLIATVSQGLSRRINVLADKSLLSAFERGSERITQEDVQRAVKNANFSRMRYRSQSSRRRQKITNITLAIAACTLLVFGIGNYFASSPKSTTPIAQEDIAYQSNENLTDSDSDSAITSAEISDANSAEIYTENSATYTKTFAANSAETASTPTLPRATIDIAAKARADTQAYVDAVVADVYDSDSLSSSETSGLSFEQLLGLKKLPPSEQLEAATQASRQAEETAARAAQEDAEKQATAAAALAATAKTAADKAAAAAENAREATESIARRIADAEAAKIAAEWLVIQEAADREAAREAQIRRAAREAAAAEKARKAKIVAAKKARKAKAAAAKTAAAEAKSKKAAEKVRAKAARIAAQKKARAQAEKTAAAKINDSIKNSSNGNLAAVTDSTLPPASDIQSDGLSPIILVQSSGNLLSSPNNIVPIKPTSPKQVAKDGKVFRQLGLADNPRWDWMPKDSYLRRRLIATRSWLSGNQKSPAWTTRLMSIGQTRSSFLEKFLRNFGDSYPLRNVMIYPARVKGADYFVVTFGVYDSRNASNVYIKNLPTTLAKGKPFAQKISDSAKQSAHFWRGIKK